MKKSILLTTIFVVVFSISTYAKSLDAHVHGMAYINIAMTKKNVQIELKAPAYSFLGFAKPKTDKEKAVYKKALLKLKKINLLHKNTHCNVKNIDTFSSLDKKHDDEHNKHNKHEKNEEHGNHEEESSHFDIEAHYDYICKNTNKVSFIDAKELFKKFKFLENIKVQWIKENAQGSISLNTKNTKIKF